jgi:PAS domain S-box-containing protein
MQDYRLRQRDYLLQISRALTAHLDLASLLELTLKSAVELLRGQVGLIVLGDADGVMHVRASYGLPPNLLSFFRPLWADLPGLGRPTLGGGRPHAWHIPDLNVRLGMVAAAAGLAVNQVVALPLAIEENWIGAIYIFRIGGGAFSAEDQALLAAFADQAAIAVHNATLYEQISNERQLLAATIDNSAEGIMILDRSGLVRQINHALAHMTGWGLEEVIGHQAAQVLILQDRNGGPVLLPGLPDKRSSQGDEPRYVEGEIVSRAGQPRRPAQMAPISAGVTATPLYDREGNLLRVILNVVDITRFRQAEDLKSTFISVVSHELKTPVALIKGYAETLQREDADWDAQTVRDSLAVIKEEADHLTHLIDSLLEASRIQAGRLKLEPTDVSLPHLAHKVVDGLRARTSVHTFEFDFPPDLPPVWGDPERLQEVLSNLIDNAVKYSPSGGTIWIGGRVDQSTVTVYVADQGIGIPPEEQARIFDRFQRVDSPEVRRAKGTGLGLYLVKAIVEAHGGRIWVESAPERGSIFIFTLPRK